MSSPADLADYLYTLAEVAVVRFAAIQLAHATRIGLATSAGWYSLGVIWVFVLGRRDLRAHAILTLIAIAPASPAFFMLGFGTGT